MNPPSGPILTASQIKQARLAEKQPQTAGETAKPARPLQVAAIEYDARNGVPRVIAKGQGTIADQIIQCALEHGVPIREDVPLTQLLNTLELGEEIPPELYLAVAEIITWVYQVEKRTSTSTAAAPTPQITKASASGVRRSVK
jgi:flagellar biosynthesis protein